MTVSPNGDEDTIEQNLESEIEDDFIFVEDLKNDDVKDNIPLGWFLFQSCKICHFCINLVDILRVKITHDLVHFTLKIDY